MLRAPESGEGVKAPSPFRWQLLSRVELPSLTFLREGVHIFIFIVVAALLYHSFGGLKN
jgi:hypothetical protein